MAVPTTAEEEHWSGNPLVPKIFALRQMLLRDLVSTRAVLGVMVGHRGMFAAIAGLHGAAYQHGI